MISGVGTVLNAKDARKLAGVIRDADVFEEVRPFLLKAFPLVDWDYLIKVECPKCGRRSRLVGDVDCLHCE